VVLYPHQALTQPQAAAFCKVQLGPGASLVSAHPVVMAAAQGLVQSANVSGRVGDCLNVRSAHYHAAHLLDWV
jgi:hypothetical protein